MENFCRFNYLIFQWRIWLFKNGNIAMQEFPWQVTLDSNNNPNLQVSKCSNIFLNIMSNFIPNKLVKVHPKDPPWVTQELKWMIKRQNRMYKNYKRHGYLNNDKIWVDEIRQQVCGKLQSQTCSSQ